MSDKNKHQLYVERRPETNDYAVRRADSSRASAVCDTQAAAITRAKENGAEIDADGRTRSPHDGWEAGQVARAVRWQQ